MDPKTWLSPEEARIGDATQRPKGAVLVASQWLQVLALFVVMAAYPHPLVWVLGTMLLGNRLLGFGVLVHECGHRTLFRTPALNDFVGRWLAAPPTFNNMRAYMRGHLEHHRLAGTTEDPDLPNYRDYPISRDRLWRKLRRDLSGQTGWRTLQGVGRNLSNYSRLSQEARGALGRAVLMNLAIFLALTAAGVPVLYLTWVLAYIFILPLVSRIRQVAEHGAVQTSTAWMRETIPAAFARTAHAGTLFSHGVNWRLEHHLGLPCPLMGSLSLLTAKGAYDGMRFETSCFHLLAAVGH